MDDVDITPPAKIAWERRRQLGFFQAWWQTLRNLLLDPRDFFTRMTPGAGIQGPLVFFLIIQLSVTVLSSGISQVAAGRAISPVFFISNIGGFFLACMVLLFLFTSLMHAVARGLGGVAGFRASLAVVAYGLGASAVFYILPNPAASLLNMGWGGFMVTHGFMRVHKITAGRAVAAYLAPGVVILALVFAVFSQLGRG